MPSGKRAEARVAARETTITLTTNEIGPEARAPVLVPEGRVFFYPYNRRDHLIDQSRPRRWRALVIENEYLRATVLPDLGGRLFSLTDKVSGHEVFTSPERFRFARIHLRGAWAPVGVELNFPKGHTAVSTIPVTCLLRHEADGGASIISGAVDLVTGMHWEVRFTLRPGVGRLLIHNRFANPTPMPHGAMYWHNAAVWVSDGFRFQSRARLAYVLRQIGPFPWRNGRDYTWYRNRLGSDDLFLVGVPEDWFGYYNHDIDFGALHVADRRRMPGKKFFSWGAAPDGRMWSRTFDLAGRHYGELQTGFLETQAQKIRFEPGRVLECDECWFPIAELGDVLQANDRLAVGLKPGRGGQPPRLTLLVTEPVGAVTVTCWDRATGRVLAERALRPRPLRARAIPLAAPPGRTGLRVCVSSLAGTLLDRDIPPLRRPSARFTERARKRIHPTYPKTPAGLVARAVNLMNWQQFSEAERLLSKALQRHHLPEAHGELGRLAFREERLCEAEAHFRAALAAGARDPQAALGLGHVLSATGRTDEAIDFFRIAVRRRNTRVSATVAEAQLLSRTGCPEQAAGRLASFVLKQPEQVDACLLLAVLEWSLGREAEAAEHLRQGVANGPTHPLALAAPWLMAADPAERARLWRRLREACAGDVQVVIEAAAALAEAGRREEAVALLTAARRDRRFPRHAMLGYLAAFWLHELGEKHASAEWLDWAAACSPERVNPSRPVEVAALRWATQQRPEDANVHLVLGNWHAARRDEPSALRAWRRAVALDPGCAIAQRNIGFTLFRHRRRLPDALEHYRAAIDRYPDELDFYLEAARLLALMGRTDERVTLLENAPASVRRSDNWIKAYAVALQDADRPADALAAMSGPDLIPWEGEYQMRHCWVECHLALGRRALAENDLDGAEHHFRETMRYPENLLIGEPHRTERSIGLYHLALAAEARGDREAARDLHAHSAGEPHRTTRALSAKAVYYSALSAQWLGRRGEARAMLRPLARGWRHLAHRRTLTLDEWFGFDQYRHVFRIGLALKALGRYDEARQALRMVGRVYGPQAEAMWHIRTLKRFGLEAIRTINRR